MMDPRAFNTVLSESVLSGAALGATFYFALLALTYRKDASLPCFATACGFFFMTGIFQALGHAAQDDATIRSLAQIRSFFAICIWPCIIYLGANIANRRLRVLDYVNLAMVGVLAIYAVFSPAGFLYQDVSQGKFVPSTLNPLSIVMRAGIAAHLSVDGYRMFTSGRRSEGLQWGLCNALLLISILYDAGIDYNLWAGIYCRHWMFIAYLAVMGYRLTLNASKDHEALLQLHESLRASEIRYHSLFAAAGDGIVVMDEKTILDGNDRAAELLGVSRSQLHGKTPLDFSPAVQRDGPSADLASLRIKDAMAGRRQQFAWTLNRPGGGVFEGEVTLTRVELNDAYRLIAVLRDVSERKRAEDERIRVEQMAMARQRLIFLGQLAAGVAHEFRNPLHGVMQFLNLTRRKADDPAKVLEYATLMDDGLKRMEGISQRLLRLGREGGAVHRQTDVRELITSTVELAAVLADKKGVAIETTFDGALPYLSADGSRIAEALLNLMQNAIDACKLGDRVIISVTRAAEAVQISVEDNGPGLPAEVRARLFEPFVTTKPIGKGTGLGLSIVRQVILDHGGSIEVDDTRTIGTRFVMRIPVAESRTWEVKHT